MELIDQCLIDGAAELGFLVSKGSGKVRNPNPSSVSQEFVGALERPSQKPPVSSVLAPMDAIVAVDSTIFPSYSNPNRSVVSDPDARWGVKHSARAKEGGKEWGWGYKLHLLTDVTFGTPLALIVTPAHRGDTTVLPLLVRKALESHPWLNITHLVADRGYDSAANHRFLVDRDITPVIHIRSSSNGGLHQGIYTTMGAPTCLGKLEMEYVRTDLETGHHLFRCPLEGCHLIEKGTKPLRHCDHEVWEDPMVNLRVVGTMSRLSPEWKRIYRLRMGIERTFRFLKHSRGLEQHCARGMKKILLQATLSVLTYQATIMARLRVGDVSGMRRMTVRVS